MKLTTSADLMATKLELELHYLSATPSPVVLVEQCKWLPPKWLQGPKGSLHACLVVERSFELQQRGSAPSPAPPQLSAASPTQFQTHASQKKPVLRASMPSSLACLNNQYRRSASTWVFEAVPRWTVCMCAAAVIAGKGGFHSTTNKIQEERNISLCRTPT